ncbi:hypothetical protein BD779DRAFT_1680922 [Infundibulicybe gibba]|nr:hypothetical protein BD779DRAFT_1680922 [Infundibulicybe gibba]
MDTPEYKSGLWSPVAFEARENVGGVCTPTGDPPLTALYDSLTTNIPHPIMAFSSCPFPPSTPLFPKAAVVQQYLESYARQFQLLPHIRFNHRVTSVERLISNWKVELSTGAVLEFDSIVVCNGHHRIPRYPDVPGVSAWVESGRAFHSAYYRRPHVMGKVVLVVGGGPSGQDISTEMGTVADVVIHSTSVSSLRDIGNIKRRGRVAKFGDNGQVTFENGSSESNIDWCILCTGYKFAYEFLPDIFPLAQYIFPLQRKYPPSSIVFMCLLFKTVPFPLVEAQMGAYLRVLADPESLDTTQEATEVITRYEHLRRTLGDDPLRITKAWNVFVDYEQFDYRDWLYNSPRRGIDPPWRMYTNGKERKGEAEEWVRGVGEGGLHEWVDLMDRLIRLSKKKNKGIDDESDKSRP